MPVMPKELETAIGSLAVQPPGPQGVQIQLPGMDLPIPPSYLTHNLTYDGKDGDIATYSGSDLRCMIDVVDPSSNDGSQGIRREFIELTTLSISIYRVKAPARALGYINPKGFARGTRTIAGTMVLTQFTVDVLYRFLFGGFKEGDTSKDSIYSKPDQLPPFNLTLFFADEFGNESCRRLFGIDMANDGTVYSSRDFFSEQTISYMASDFTPLMPVDSHALMFKPTDSSKSAGQKTPMSVMPSHFKSNDGLDLFNLKAAPRLKTWLTT